MPIKFSPQTLLNNIDSTLQYIKKVNESAFIDFGNTIHYGPMTNSDRVTAINQFTSHNVLKLTRINNEFRLLRKKIVQFIENRLG